MLRIDEITSFDGFLGLEPLWNAVLAKSDTDIPFLTFEWFSSWWRGYGSGKQPYILVVRDGQEPVAIAPLMRSRTFWRGLPARTVSFMANANSFRTALILARNDDSLVERLLSHVRARGGFDIMRLEHMVKDSFSHRSVLDALTRWKVPCVEMRGEVSPYIPVQESWDEFVKKRSRNFRSKLRLTENQLKNRSGYEIKTYVTDNIPGAMEQLLSISRRTWKYAEGTAIASNGDNIHFYRSLATAAAAAGWLKLRVLRLGGEPVAFAFNLDYRGVSFFLKTGFDEKYRNFSSGEFLLHRSIKECFDGGFREYDLLGGSEPYKLKLTSLIREHRKLAAFDTGLPGRLMFFVEKKLVPSAKKFLGRAKKAG